MEQLSKFDTRHCQNTSHCPDTSHCPVMSPVVLLIEYYFLVMLSSQGQMRTYRLGKLIVPQPCLSLKISVPRY